MSSNSNNGQELAALFPPSTGCSCSICTAFCARPGWWTVEEAALALSAGYGGFMMLEIAPEKTFGVLSPAFRGAEKNFGLQEFSQNGCTFLDNGLCRLHSTGYMPLECRFCHHDRAGQGALCHAAIEKQWKSPEGRRVISEWIRAVDFRYADYYYGMIVRRGR